MIFPMAKFSMPRWIGQSAVGLVLVLSLTAVFGATSPQQPAPAPAAAANGACPAGFSGSPETGCVDVDECTAYNGGCHALTACENTPGSRACGVCPYKFAGRASCGCYD